MKQVFRVRLDLHNCRSLHWGRGLKPCGGNYVVAYPSRSLHWERGLKFWIDPAQDNICRHSLRWECGLKYAYGRECSRQFPSHSLHWERGLKRRAYQRASQKNQVTPCIRGVD